MSYRFDPYKFFDHTVLYIFLAALFTVIVGIATGTLP